VIVASDVVDAVESLYVNVVKAAASPKKPRRLRMPLGWKKPMA
jgi:hypothetical protein